ncbi:Uncharacterised protein [Streptococcus pneumoniae]|nr:Uncharacterised protein [Streptococcus pneumoniae]
MCDLLSSFVVQLHLYHRTYLLYLRMFFRREESRTPYVYLVYRSKSLDLMGNVFDQLLSEHLLITEVLFLFSSYLFHEVYLPKDQLRLQFSYRKLRTLHRLVNRLHVHRIHFHLYIRNCLLLRS